MRRLFLFLLVIIAAVAEGQPGVTIMMQQQIAATVASYDTDAQNFFTALETDAAPVTLNSTQKGAVNQLVLDLKTASIWTKYYAIYPFIGGTSAAHKYNLKDPRDLDAAYRLTFSGTITHTSSGAAPDGASGTANTHFIPSASLGSVNSALLQFYSQTNSTSAGYDIGGRGATTTSRLDLIIKYTDNNSYLALNTNDISGGNVVSDTRGLFTDVRTGAGATAFYKNATSIHTNTTAASTLSTNAIHLFANNDNGSVGSFCNRATSGVGIADGMNSTEVGASYTAWQAFQNTLGRQQ